MELVGRYVASPQGKVELAAIAPHTDRARLEEDLAETAEAIDYVRTSGKPQPAARGAAIRLDFSGIPDLADAVHKLRIEGASLDPKELLDVFNFLDRAADVRSILNAVAERFPRLGERGRTIGEFRPLLKDLEGKILPDGSVADHASVALARIRREIEKQKKAIQSSLERFLKAHQEEGILQEEFVTIRNERFVVPLIAGQQRRIDGVIHGASSSGHTLFVEPLETIDLNNDLVRLTEEEAQEVHRILRELTARVRGYADAIRRTFETMAKLEVVFAKARFAGEFGCVVPRFSTGDAPRLILRDARHPLLEDVLRRQRKRVEPISLALEGRDRTLVVSGPNTGGKTVSLKTVGLLTLMAQSALPVPAAEAEFPLFDQVLADIGDNQSIQESLSTFSAHISHIREMALDVTPDSLVLLDELGAATDPDEGGALAVAIVDHFRAAGAFTLASTHLLALKIYGTNAAGVLNGSMGFDELTLEPTYRLHVGAPGKSAGLDIARRLGLPEAILLCARESLSGHAEQVARFVGELHRRLEEASALAAEYRRKQEELAAREQQIAQEWEKRESVKLKELERRTEQVLAKFEELAQDVLAGLAQKVKALRQVSKAKRELREEFETTVLSTQDDARQGELRRPRVAEGARVRLKGIREPARVRRMLPGERIEVEAGFMKLQVPLDDVLEVLPDAGAAASKLPQNVTFKPAPELAPLVQEINVIGEHVDQALERVDQFLDRAAMATASRVRIVHGHGMGILRKAISELLAKHPHVAKFYPAPQQEGGAGATIVELKD